MFLCVCLFESWCNLVQVFFPFFIVDILFKNMSFAVFGEKVKSLSNQKVIALINTEKN